MSYVQNDNAYVHVTEYTHIVDQDTLEWVPDCQTPWSGGPDPIELDPLEWGHIKNGTFIPKCHVYVLPNPMSGHFLDHVGLTYVSSIHH